MRDETNTRTAYSKARRHSFAVAVLKRALPLTAFAVVGGFAAAAVLSGAFNPDTSTRAASVTEGAVVMANPRLDGVDRNQRPFAVKAEAARQATVEPALVALDRIDATLPTGTDEFATIDATAGIYDTKQETLVLRSGVTVRGMKGLDMDLQEASFDMGEGTMVSEAPVEVRSRHAAIDAESMKVLESGKRILFSRRVRMVIHNDGRPEAAPIADKSALLGTASSSSAPWVHTGKLSLGNAIDRTPAVRSAHGLRTETKR